MNETLSPQQENAAAWQRLAIRTARRVNAAWWFAAFSPLLLVVAAVACAWTLIQRSRGVPVPLEQLALWGGAAVMAAAGGAWLMARRKFCPTESALVRLESQMGLNNALSAARQGITAWPPAPAKAADALSANLRRILPPVAGAAALIAAGILFPVSPAIAAAAPPPPRSHSEIQAAIDLLKQSEAVKKEDLEKLQKQLDELKQQDPGDWYSHASQEAADTLREGMNQNLRQMSENLERGVNSINSLSKPQELSPQAREQAASDFKQAMKGLMNSPLGLNEKLMEQLSKIDPAKMKGLSEKQIEEMKQAMKQCSGACKEGCSGGQGEGKGKGKGNDPGDGGDGKNGDGEGEGDPSNNAEGKEGTGRGGVQRGPGVAPLPLAREGSGKNEIGANPLESSDLNRARPGDAFGVSDAQHNPDKSPLGPQSGGAVNSPGSGGEAVGSESLVPADRAVLRKFFQ